MRGSRFFLSLPAPAQSSCPLRPAARAAHVGPSGHGQRLHRRSAAAGVRVRRLPGSDRGHGGDIRDRFDLVGIEAGKGLRGHRLGLGPERVRFETACDLDDGEACPSPIFSVAACLGVRGTGVGLAVRTGGCIGHGERHSRGASPTPSTAAPRLKGTGGAHRTPAARSAASGHGVGRGPGARSRRPPSRQPPARERCRRVRTRPRSASSRRCRRRSPPGRVRAWRRPGRRPPRPPSRSCRDRLRCRSRSP